jgi:hypothetical protein
MTLPREEVIGDYTCYLRNRPFNSPVAVIDNRLHLYYGCEERLSGRTISREIIIDFNDDNIKDIHSQLEKFIIAEG